MKGKISYKGYYDYLPEDDFDTKSYYSKSKDKVENSNLKSSTNTIVKYYIVYKINKQVEHCVNPKTGEVEVPRQLVFVTKDIEAVQIALEVDSSLMYEAIDHSVPLISNLRCAVQI